MGTRSGILSRPTYIHTDRWDNETKGRLASFRALRFHIQSSLKIILIKSISDWRIATGVPLFRIHSGILTLCKLEYWLKMQGACAFSSEQAFPVGNGRLKRNKDAEYYEKLCVDERLARWIIPHSVSNFFFQELRQGFRSLSSNGFGRIRRNRHGCTEFWSSIFFLSRWK